MSQQKAFTAVFLNVTTDEAGEITSHPKWSAGSWSHALNDRDEARALLADGGKGEAVAGYVIPQRLNSDDPVISLYRKPEGGARFPLYAAPQAECAPLPKQEALGEPFQTVLNENRWNLYAEEKPKGMTGCGKCDDDPAECAWHQQCQAECAPREAQPVAFVEGDEVQRVLRWNKDVAAFNYGIGTALYAAPTPERAQPVGPRTTLNFDGTVDITCAHCGGNGCFACLSANAACASNERADADTSGAKMTNAQIDEIGVKAGLMERVGKKQVALAAELSATEMRAAIRTLLATPASQERADAGKDAARYQWFRQGKLLWVTVPVRDKHVKYLLGHKPEAGFADALDQAIDAAILSANKETPERAEPRALTDERAKEIAQQVHAECSRIPGATFYNAAMSAIEQAVKER